MPQQDTVPLEPAPFEQYFRNSGAFTDARNPLWGMLMVHVREEENKISPTQVAKKMLTTNPHLRAAFSIADDSRAAEAMRKKIKQFQETIYNPVKKMHLPPDQKETILFQLLRTPVLLNKLVQVPEKQQPSGESQSIKCKSRS